MNRRFRRKNNTSQEDIVVETPTSEQPVPNETAGEDTAAEPSAPAEPVVTSETSGDEEEDKPKRVGWWQRGRVVLLTVLECRYGKGGPWPPFFYAAKERCAGNTGRLRFQSRKSDRRASASFMCSWAPANENRKNACPFNGSKSTPGVAAIPV